AGAKRSASSARDASTGVGTGKISATSSLQRTSFDTDRIVAVLSRCLDGSCSTAADVDWVVFTRSWRTGIAHTLALIHQTANNRVLFSVAGGRVAADTRALRNTPPPDQD